MDNKVRTRCLGGQLGWFERCARVSRRAWPAAVQLGSMGVAGVSKIGAWFEDYKIVDRGATGL